MTHTPKPVGYVIGGFLDERYNEFERNGTVMYHQAMGMATTPLYTEDSHYTLTDEVKRLREEKATLLEILTNYMHAEEIDDVHERLEELAVCRKESSEAIARAKASQ